MLVIAWCGAAGVSPAVDREDNKPLVSEEMLWEAIDAREKAVTSFDWQWIQRIQVTPADKRPDWMGPSENESPRQPKKPVDYTRTVHLIIDGERIRWEEERGPLPGIPPREKKYSAISVFDGLQTRAYRPQSGETPCSGYLYSGDHTHVYDSVEEHPILLCFRFRKWMSTHPIDGDVFLTFGKEDLNGTRCATLTWRLGTNGVIQTKAWFDSAARFVPIRLQYGPASRTTTIQVEYAPSDQHGFVPVAWQASSPSGPRQAVHEAGTHDPSEGDFVEGQSRGSQDGVPTGIPARHASA